jgi:hypothetical protein
MTLWRLQAHVPAWVRLTSQQQHLNLHIHPMLSLHNLSFAVVCMCRIHPVYVYPRFFVRSQHHAFLYICIVPSYALEHNVLYALRRVVHLLQTLTIFLQRMASRHRTGDGYG